MSDYLTAARRRLAELEARHRAGELDASGYEQQRRAVERELSDRLMGTGDAAPPAVRPSGRLLGVLTAAVLAVAIGGYLATGSPSLAGRDLGIAAPAAEASASDPTGTQQIAAMVDKLAARMKERPDDAEGWVMLGRSYTVLGRFAEALPAYARALALTPNDANLLADYADAVAATQGSANNAETVALVDRALAIDPGHPKALALGGTADFDRGDFARAMARWQKIVDRLPPESPLIRQIEGSIADARQRLEASTRPPGAAAASAIASGERPRAASGAPAASPSLSGTVTLDPALAGKASPTDTVFVYARAVGGGRMPLALQRATVAQLPLSFRLDDAMAMGPGAVLSSAPQVIVTARISKSGQAMTQPGDLVGETAAVKPGSSDLAIRIDRVVGAGS